MDQPTNSKESRGPVSLRIKFRSASLDQFIERYATDVSRGGIFIRTREPLAVGTQLKFDFQLQDAAPLMAGEGTVVWIREHDPNRAGVTPGMGVRFDKLTPVSQPVLERILADKATRDQSGGIGAGKPGVGGMAVRRPSSSFTAVDPAVPSKPAPAPTPPAASGFGGPAGGRPAPLGSPLGTSMRPAASPMASPTAPSPFAGGGQPPRSPFVGGGGGAPPEGGQIMRPRMTSAGMPAARPAPVLFEPPTADDIDKALEALTEMPGPAPALGGPGGAFGAPSEPSAPAAAMADYPSNEPTRVAGDSPRPAFGQGRVGGVGSVGSVGSVGLSAASISPAALSPSGPGLGAGVPLESEGFEEEPSEKTELSLDASAVLAEMASLGLPGAGGAPTPPPLAVTPPPASFSGMEPTPPPIGYGGGAALEPGGHAGAGQGMEPTPPPLPATVSATPPFPGAAAPPEGGGQPTVIGFAVPPSLLAEAAAKAPKPGAPMVPPGISPALAAAAAAQQRKPSRAPVIVVGLLVAAGVAAGAVYYMRPGLIGGTTPVAATPPGAEPAPGAAAPAPPAPPPPPGSAAPSEPAAAAPSEPAPTGAPPAAAKPAEEAPAAPKAAEPAAAAAAAKAEPAAKPEPADSEPAPAGKGGAAARKAAAARARAAKAAAAAAASDGEAKPAAEAKPDTDKAKPDTDKAGAPVEDLTARGAGAKEAAAPAAGGEAAVVTSHVLRITSVPAGADVIVDGNTVGKTPYVGKDLDPSAPHAIRLKKDGYDNHDHMISASDWSRPRNGVQIIKLTVKMRRAPGAEPEKPAAGGEAGEPKDEAPASE